MKKTARYQLIFKKVQGCLYFSANKLNHFCLAQEEAVTLPCSVAFVDIAVNQIRIRSVLEILVRIFNLLPRLGDFFHKSIAVGIKG